MSSPRVIHRFPDLVWISWAGCGPEYVLPRGWTSFDISAAVQITLWLLLVTGFLALAVSSIMNLSTASNGTGGAASTMKEGVTAFLIWTGGKVNR